MAHPAMERIADALDEAECRARRHLAEIAPVGTGVMFKNRVGNPVLGTVTRTPEENFGRVGLRVRSAKSGAETWVDPRSILALDPTA